MKFGEALEFVNTGNKIARKGWNGKNMFVFQRPSDTLKCDFIEKVKSLPESVKQFLVLQNKDVEFTAYLCLYSADGKIVNGWLPSQTDMQANDWMIIA